jgi:HK97 family phage portal protein
MRWWPLRRKTDPEALVTFGDPAALHLLGSGGGDNYSGATVNENTMLGLSGMFRALSLLSGTMGALPLNTYQDVDGDRRPAKSVFDNPAGPDSITPFEWKRLLVVYLKIHGNAVFWKLRNGGGAVIGYEPFHPLSVSMIDPTTKEIVEGKGPLGGLWFDVTLDNGDRIRTDAYDILHIPGMSIDGKRGLSLAQVARGSLGTAIAGDRAAGRTFGNGAMISGMVTPESDVDGFDAKGIRRVLNRSVLGYENAGGIAILNRLLKFTPWTMTNADAQFLESRQFSIEEISRWTGVPPHLLMQTEKQTSWGTGVESQNEGMGRTVLGPDARLIEERCSREIGPSTRFVEFDFSRLERPSPAKELELIIEQWNADLLTLNETRKLRNLPEIPGGNVTKTRWEAAAGGQPAAV